jgi:hypothetical protein
MRVFRGMVRLGLITFAICPLLAAAASGQTIPRKPFPKGPFEKYDNPPAPAPPALPVSPALTSRFGVYTSYQVNIDANGNNKMGDAANEPSICVDPTDGNRMSIGWRQFDSVVSNFRQAGFAYSVNGGRNWISPGVLQPGIFRSDPVLNSDNAGRFFYLSLLQTFFDDLWQSLTGGQTWVSVAPADGGDKEWFTVDNTNSSGRGFEYQCWSTEGNNYGGRQFSRSTNAGSTWLDPVNIPNSPAWGTLDVDSDGNVFVGGVNLATGQIWCVRSTTAKNGALVPSFDRSTAVNLGGNIVVSEPINPEGLVGQVFLAVDRSGTSTNNNIYILASVHPSGSTTGSDVMFVRSTDGGSTFSLPRRINDDPINHSKWHWFGTLSVAQNGRIDVVWFDSRNAANNTDSQLFYSFSIDGGTNWSANVAVSNSFNPFLGYPNQNKIGDYITVVSDNAGANVAYAATFNAEEDIYYVRITPTTTALLDSCYPNFTTVEGCDALGSLTTGVGNTGLGWRSLVSDTTGSFNTGVGGGALVLDNGNSNSAVGAAALLLNTTGSNNTGAGTDALVFNDSGNSNTAAGFVAVMSNTTGGSNTAIGSESLTSNTSGNNNTAIGNQALQSSTTTADHVCIGRMAGSEITSASNNIILGHHSGVHTVFGQESDRCYIDNIHGAPVSDATAAIVIIDSDGRLGTLDMEGPGGPSHKGIRPRPIPDTPSEAMLNLQVQELEKTIAQRQQHIEALTKQLKEQSAQIHKLNTQLELRTRAAKMIVNKPTAVLLDGVHGQVQQ